MVATAYHDALFICCCVMKKLMALAGLGAALIGCAHDSDRFGTGADVGGNGFSYTRIHCSADGESHFEDVSSGLEGVFLPGALKPIFIQSTSATEWSILSIEPMWGETDLALRRYHPAPFRQFIFYLDGSMSVVASDGEVREFSAGDVLLAEDVAPCKGHISVVGERGVRAAIVR